MNDVTTLLAAPTEADAVLALQGFAEQVRGAYGARVRSLYLFGSRARGDHRPGSDADIAVVLTGIKGSVLDEKMRLVDLAFDALTDHGLMIQPWPFTVAQWERREHGGRFADLLEAARRDAVTLEAAL